MIGLQMLFTYVPTMNRLFGTAPIGARTWLWIIGVALLVHVVMEVEKWIRRQRERRGAVSPAC
jgi:hypothetical protein